MHIVSTASKKIYIDEYIFNFIKINDKPENRFLIVTKDLKDYAEKLLPLGLKVVSIEVDDFLKKSNIKTSRFIKTHLSQILFNYGFTKKIIYHDTSIAIKSSIIELPFDCDLTLVAHPRRKFALIELLYLIYNGRYSLFQASLLILKYPAILFNREMALGGIFFISNRSSNVESFFEDWWKLLGLKIFKERDQPALALTIKKNKMKLKLINWEQINTHLKYTPHEGRAAKSLASFYLNFLKDESTLIVNYKSSIM